MSSVDSLTTAVSWNLVIKPRLVYCIKPLETGASATEKKAMRPISVGGLIGKEKQLERIRTRIDQKSCYVWKGIGVLSDLEYSGETSFKSMTRTSNPVIDEILGIQLE